MSTYIVIIKLFCLNPSIHTCTISICCSETGITLPHKHFGLSLVSHRKWNSLIDRLKYDRCLVFINEKIVSSPSQIRMRIAVCSYNSFFTSFVSLFNDYFFFKPKDTFLSLENDQGKQRVIDQLCASQKV